MKEMYRYEISGYYYEGMTMKEMYRYEISGYYYEGMTMKEMYRYEIGGYYYEGMTMKEMYRYEISGYYYEGDERKHFCKEVEAPDNIVAMQMVLGEIMWKSSEYFNDAAVKLDTIHYECLR